jgi:hypothetical protein
MLALCSRAAGVSDGECRTIFGAEALVLIGYRGSLFLALRLGLHSCMAMFGFLMAYGKRDGDTLCLRSCEF